MTDEKQAGPLSGERQRLKSQGYTDAEISQILVNRAVGGSSGPSPAQGALSNVLSSIVAVAGYAGWIFTSLGRDLGMMLDRSTPSSARGGAFVAVVVKSVVIGALAFAAWQEWQQHIISQTEITASQAQKIRAEAEVARDVSQAQAEKLRQEANVAKEVAAGERAKSCSERLKLLSENFYMADMNEDGTIKPGTKTAAMNEKYNRECGGITGGSEADAPPADTPETRACGQKFDALFNRLQQTNKSDIIAIDTWGIDLFKHRQTCQLTAEQVTRLAPMIDVLKPSEERIKTAAAGILVQRLAEETTKRFLAEDYAGAYDNAKKRVEAAETFEQKKGQQPGRLSAAVLGEGAYYAVFARDFSGAIAMADRAINLYPPNLVAQTNKAHALMFLGRTSEAKAIYLAHKDEMLSPKQKWQDGIFDDFMALEHAGLSNPLMDEVRPELSGSTKLLNTTPDVAQTPTALRTPAGFDCVNGKHMGTDFVICASPQLLDAEARIEDAYKAARAARGDAVKIEQIDWIKHYGPNCGLPLRGRPSPGLIQSAGPCVASAIEQRIRQLQQEQ